MHTPWQFYRNKENGQRAVKDMDTLYKSFLVRENENDKIYKEYILKKKQELAEIT